MAWRWGWRCIVGTMVLCSLVWAASDSHGTGAMDEEEEPEACKRCKENWRYIRDRCHDDTPEDGSSMAPLASTQNDDLICSTNPDCMRVESDFKSLDESTLPNVVGAPEARQAFKRSLSVCNRVLAFEKYCRLQNPQTFRPVCEGEESETACYLMHHCLAA